MSDDYISGLRKDLVAAAARQQHAGRATRVARPLHPRVWSPAAVLGAAAAVAVLLVVVVSLRGLEPTPRPADAQIVSTVRLGGHPRDAVAIGSALVVADYEGRLLRIDPGDPGKRVRLAAEGTPVSLVADGEAVWVMITDRDVLPPHPRLLKIDARTGRPLARLKAPGMRDIVAAGAAGVWYPFGHFGGDSGRVPRRPDWEDLVVGERAVWSRFGDTVHENDTAGHLVNRTRGISPTLANGSQRTMLPDADGAWVVGQTAGLLHRIEGGRVIRTVKLGRTAGVLARAGSVIWVSTTSSAGRYELVRVTADGRVTGHVRLGRLAPQTIVPAGKRLWVISTGGDAVLVNPE